jgi:DNA-binding NarL/FixJ family response regulator
VSEGTVRKHLENIYTRLNVSRRTAAVTRAFPHLAAI